MKKTTYTNLASNFIELSPDLICFVGFDGYFKFINPACEKLLGYSIEELLSKPFLEFIHPDDHQKNKEEFSNLTQKETIDFENRYICKDGSILNIEWKVTLTDEENITYCIGRDITNRKQAEKTLRENKKFSKEIIESLPNGFSILDKDGIHKDVNLAFCKMTGFAKEELIGVGVPHPYWPEEQYENIQEAFVKTSQGNFESFELVFKNKNGKRFPVLVTPSQIKDVEGNVISNFATVVDITERKQAEETLRQSEATISNKLKAITEPEGDISDLELSDIIDAEILESLMEDFYQITGMLGAVLDVSGKVLVAVGWQDICTKFHRCNPNTLKNCIESDTILSSGVPEGTFKAYHCKNHMWDIVTPIMVGGRHVGNVFMGQYFLEDEVPDYDFFRKQAKRYGFDEKEYLAALDRTPRFSKETVDAGMKFYSKLASLISTLSFSSIKQSRMLSQQKIAEEELIQAKNKAEKNQKLYEDLVQSSHNLIWKCDLEGKFTFLNSAWENTHGYKVKEMLGRPFSDFQRKEIFERDVIEFTKHLEGGFVKDYETTHIVKDGTEIPLIFNALPLFNSLDEIIGTQGTAFDISKLKQTEIALKVSEERIRLFTENVPDFLLQIDRTGKINYINKTFEGLTQKDVIGSSVYSWIPDETSEEFKEKTEKVFRYGNSEIIEYLSEGAKGEPIWFESQLGPFEKSGIITQVIIVARDITERKKAEEELIKSEERFNLAMAAAKEGLYDWNLVTNEIYYSPGWKSMLGYDDNELPNDFSIWEKLVSPEDAVKIAKIRQEELINKNIDRFELEFKMKHKEGYWVDILSRSKAFFDENGKAIRMVGTHVDISKRMHEEKILATELRLFDYAINHSEEELLQKFLDEAEDLTGSEIGFYHYIEDDQESISLQTWSSNTLNNMCKGSGDATQHYPISKAGVWIDCIKERKPVIHNDYSSLEYKKGLPEGHAPIIRELVVPVIRGGQVMAVFGVGNKKLDYNETDVQSVQRLADVAWETVVRKQAEEKIHIAEKNLKNTFDLSPSIIAKANMNEGRFIQVNKAITKILGYSIDEFTSRPYMEFVHPDDRQSTIDIATEQLKGNDVTFFENRYLCKDGSYKWMAWHGTKPDDDGVVTTIGSDINERKHAELKLNQSTQLLEASQSIAKLGGWELDLDTNNLFWTAETYRIHETSPEEFEPTVDAGVGYFLPESRRIISNALDKAIKYGEGYDLELETLTTKGRRIDIRTTCEVKILDGKPTKLVGIFQDITEQKKAEEKIITVEENLKNTFDLSPSIICKANLETGYFVEANQAVTRILGYSVEEYTSTPFIKLIHPDDQQKSTDRKLAQLKGEDVIFFENRYLCKDGSYKWMAWNGTKADENGIVTAIGSDISERKIIEQEIVKTKLFYENITEGVQDGIWVTDKNDVIFYANSAMEKIAGLPREQIQGNNVLKDFTEDTTGEFNKFYKQAKKEKKPVWYLIKITKPTSEIVWENGWLIPQYENENFTGIICTIRDVTKRKKAEGSVRRLSTAVEQSPSIIVITDTKGIVEYVNPIFSELTGYSRDEVIGRQSNILKSGEQDIGFYNELWKTVESGEVWRGQFHNKKKNGKLFWEAASISSILNDSGEIINFIKIGEDITQQKYTEEKLNIALEKALESDRLKSAFLANMSHEIRTPMNGILGFINLLNEPNLSKSKIGKYSAIINKSGERLLNTINDIMDISKIEAKEVVISRTETCINTEIEELYSFFLHEANNKGLSLTIQPSLSAEQPTVITDSHKLHGILTNLIKNSIKFTENGHITFGYSINENFIEFYVKDTGIGIPKDRINAVFNRFEQADIEDVRVLEGSGLGLAISKAYIEMLGGEISVESVVGKGSKFVFTIPYVKKTEKEVLEVIESISVDRKEINKLNLLIVEDDDISSEFLKSSLEGIFKEIIFVDNGIDAIEICRDNPELDLVLMDIKIPLINGYDATKEIRKFNKELIIVAQTAYSLQGDREKAIEVGCNDYISKPINKIKLLEVIKKLLDSE